MDQVRDALVSECQVSDFAASNLTPTVGYYVDGQEDGFEGTSDESLPLTTEIEDKYTCVTVTLPRE